MWSNRQKMHDADAERAKQNLPEPTGLWRVPGAHVAAMGASFGDRVGGLGAGAGGVWGRVVGLSARTQTRVVRGLATRLSIYLSLSPLLNAFERLVFPTA